MAKPNFRHQKLLRERAKKARQLEKAQRKNAARTDQDAPAESPAEETAETTAGVVTPETVVAP